MKKVMEPIEVATTTDGMIDIIQADGPREEAAVIRISPDQVDVLVKWLNAARTELLKK